MLYLETRLPDRVMRWSLPAGEYVVGRSPHCDIVIPHDAVSRRHARLRISNGSLVCEDLGSRHGLWIGHDRKEWVELRAPAEFWIAHLAAAVRRGISVDDPGIDLGSSSTSSTASDAGGRIESAFRGRTLSAAAATDLNMRDLERVLEILRSAGSGAALSARWLELATRAAGAAGGMLLDLGAAGTANAPTVIASWGELPSALLAALGDDAQAFPLLSIPVSVAGDPHRGRVVLHPVPNPEMVSPIVELLAHLSGRAQEPLQPAPGGDALRERAGGGGATAAIPACGDERDGPLDDPTEFMAFSERSSRLLEEVDGLANTSLPVFVCGESGTGKELIARRLHALSERADGRFVAINCAALPAELLEAELFGIGKGVATGVSEREGWLVRASGGTLFLDEVGDLPEPLQPKLLRALENGHVYSVGSREPTPIDVRLISASHKDLRQKALDGSFRVDLLFRLAGATVRVPPLRERREEILPLAQRFVCRSARSHGRRVSGVDVDAAKLLAGYDWPGNVRELAFAMDRAVALADGPVIHAGLLPEEIRPGAGESIGTALVALDEDWRTARRAFDRIYFEHLLRKTGGNVSEISRRAGLSRSSLYRQLDQLGLKDDDQAPSP